ncbi:outer membrane beta-barrel protein [Colwellia sp. MB02u-9]|uniref:outer membrane beta-barrel protein n=1 Tax=Colwellia sp. MB02u-9 TaxID=2759823 RepID=UPI0015F76DEF|nr:outer membrane beta-barrel protein [Colwellia sp. MB02u-9]MBA6295516.1 outer membrane beta-barrel protein [Colwellia sp. MB02u-9]
MNFSWLVAIFFAISAFSALVQAESDNNAEFTLASEAGYIDNFFYQARNEQSTAYYTLSSDLALTSNRQHSAFNFDAKLATYFFDKFNNDDHTDFTITPTYQFKFSQNQRLYMSALWLNSYNYRGTGLSLSQAEALSKGDEKENIGASIGYEYGTFESQGKLNFDLTYHENKFTTRRTDTRRLDTEILNFKSNFDYLLSGKTFLAFDIAYKVTEYPNDPISNRDSITALVGVKWFSTVISELNFLVGYQQLKFSDNRLRDDHAFKWRFDYIWRLADFTQVHIVSNRHFDESYRLISSYRLVQSQQIDFEHGFTERFNVLATVGLTNEKFISRQNTEQEDYLFSTLTLAYQHSDRLSLQLSYDYQALDTRDVNIDYSYNKMALSVKIKL